MSDNRSKRSGVSKLQSRDRSRRAWSGTLVFVVGILAITLASSSCFVNGQPQTPVPVRIGITNEEVVGLIYVAQDQNYFVENGLGVSLTRYDSGVSAIYALAKGEADLGLMAEYPVIISAFRKQEISILANIDKANLTSIVGLRDHGIEEVADLKGKRIGVTRQTTAEFYLGRFLKLNGMDLQDVTLVDTKTTQLVEAVSTGSVDAMIGSESYVREIKEKQGDNLVIWSADGSQPVFAVLVATHDWITQQPDLVKRLLRSLAQAETYVIDHPGEARAIIRENLKVDDAYMAGVWQRNHYSLLLDNSLIAAMDAEARSMISNNLTTEKTVPNFKEHIYLDGLKAVMPDAVGIVP